MSTTSTPVARFPENIGNGPEWVSTPDLVEDLTCGDFTGAELEHLIAVAQERLLVVKTMRQKAVASIYAALKVAGVARVTMAPANRAWRDSKGGKAIARRVLASA